MAVGLPPPYPDAPIGAVEPNELPGKPPVIRLNGRWGIYFRDQRQYLAQLPVSVTPSIARVADQNATIGTTTLFTPTQSGFYAFEYYLAIRTAAGVSSSAQVTLGWTDSGAKTTVFAAITGNTTGTTGWGRYAFYAEAGAPITYAVAYLSNPAAAMRFDVYPMVSAVATVAS